VKRIIMLCVLGCIGCGDDEDAAPQCNDLIDDVCDRVVECVPQQAATHAICVQRMQQTLSCESAKRVSATYYRCIQQIKADSCQVLFPTNPQTAGTALSLPADCTSAIQVFAPGAPLAGSPGAAD
jgi:hypothetical protein